MPYLLAMEGEFLWHEQQALFMGVAKLIFGLSIALNPLFGLIGDHATVLLTHGLGRRLFIRVGVVIASLGIFICIGASSGRNFQMFIFGIVVWRIGEALNDVTTDALCPELLPPEQFALASSVKSAGFLVGGVAAYGMLIVLRGVHYSWLYYCYLFGMYICSIPPLLLLDREVPVNREMDPFIMSAISAYLTPARLRGGFPHACLAVFIFTCGTAPMFFFILMVRDLVGITETSMLQVHFSCASITFFLAAAAAALLCRQENDRAGNDEQMTEAERLEALEASMSVRINGIKHWLTLFAICLLSVPVLSIAETFVHFKILRIEVFYLFTISSGLAFGTVFARFQDALWGALPPDCCIANAMGFSAMCRLAGIGVGNFVAGMILDVYKTGYSEEAMTASNAYKHRGYSIMCATSAAAVLVARYLAGNLPEIVKCERARFAAEEETVPAVGVNRA
eukprot:NODE_5605_length_1753_cov_6.674047.p1 GENE.NODE_5605_length_1753_cov_6.674047~~NODE_5605_length_1753_cov_6.674047.p1  ORF type:complete len:531 (+),score=160.56 NODE_5605_length_1753_cov_6.674047:236-1594(+)